MERTGYSGGFHFVAQWFPKLARLEPDGTFAHFAFHPQSEFYADFGRYDVSLEVTRLTPADQSSVEEPTLNALRFALPYLSRKFGSYPYSTLTVVHPPEFA